MSENVDRELAVLEARARHYARSQDAEQGARLEIIVFRRAETRYALPVAALREVREVAGFQALPGASATVPGAFAYRGEILSLHDLAAFLGSSAELPDWSLVVEHEGRRLGILADEIQGVEEVFIDEIRPIPLTFAKAGGLFRGLVSGETLLLNPIQCFETQSFYRSA